MIIPPITGDEFTPALDTLCIGLSQVLFPIVVLLGLTGLAVGILNVHDHFTIPAIAPLVWNVVIIAGLVGLAPLFEGPDRLYAYAIGVVAGTLVQLLMMIPALRRIGYPVFHIRLPRRGDERVKRVLLLMLPVSVGLGLININLLLNSTIGSLVSAQAPRAIDAAFRIYMLPAGDVQRRRGDGAVPAARAARRPQGLRRPARHHRARPAPDRAAADPRGRGDDRAVASRSCGSCTSAASGRRNRRELTAEALFWFGVSLPFSGFVLMLTRAFFSLQRPWVPTTLAVGSLAINAILSYVLAEPLGIAGIVIGTAVSNAALVVAEAIWLGGLDIHWGRIAGMLLGAAILGGVTYGVWYGLDELLGRSLIAQIVSVGTALVAGGAAYAGVVLGLRIPEAQQVIVPATAAPLVT